MLQAIDLMDEAASNMRVQLESTPEEIDSLQRALYRVQVEEKALAKEKDKVTHQRLVCPVWKNLPQKPK